MGVIALRDSVAGELAKLGLNPVALLAGEADMPGDYLIFEEQILQSMPKPNLARFALYIVRSDLEGLEGAYGSVDKLAPLNDANGIQTSGAKLHSYKGGLYTYKATIEIVWAKR